MPADEYLHLAHKKIKNFYDIRPANTEEIAGNTSQNS